jgi:hypothetical protein
MILDKKTLKKYIIESLQEASIRGPSKGNRLVYWRKKLANGSEDEKRTARAILGVTEPDRSGPEESYDESAKGLANRAREMLTLQRPHVEAAVELLDLLIVKL